MNNTNNVVIRNEFNKSSGFSLDEVNVQQQLEMLSMHQRKVHTRINDQQQNSQKNRPQQHDAPHASSKKKPTQAFRNESNITFSDFDVAEQQQMLQNIQGKKESEKVITADEHQSRHDQHHGVPDASVAATIVQMPSHTSSQTRLKEAFRRASYISFSDVDITEQEKILQNLEGGEATEKMTSEDDKEYHHQQQDAPRAISQQLPKRAFSFRRVGRISFSDFDLTEQEQILQNFQGEEQTKQMTGENHKEYHRQQHGAHHASSQQLAEEDYLSRRVSRLSMSDVDISEQIEILQKLEEKKETQRMIPEQRSSQNSGDQSSFVQQRENLQKIQEELNKNQENEQDTREMEGTVPGIEIYPGHIVPLYDTIDAIRCHKGTTIVDCEHCMDSEHAVKPGVVMSTRLHCVKYASMVICPICGQLSSVPNHQTNVRALTLNESVCVGVLEE